MAKQSGMLPALKFALLLGIVSLAVPASAAEDDIHFTVRKGDNLFTLAESYFLRLNDYRLVQRLNNIRDPYRIPIGTVIKIPRSVLKYKAGGARLLSVRGNVSIGSSSTPARTGQILAEGATIVTSGNSFVTLILDDGSRVSLPSNSVVELSRLRTYVLGGSIDYDLDVKKGGAHSRVVKLKSADDRYQSRTPRAVSAVRGTEFQSRYDEVTGSDYTEVVEGLVGVQTASKLEEVGAGHGLAIGADGAPFSEALLPQPAVAEAGRVQTDAEVSFAVENAKPDARYLMALASDAGFTDQIAETIAPGGKASFSDLGNGNYFLRAREIAPSGMEGQPATYGFKRRLNGIKASFEAVGNNYKFKWSGEGDGVRRFHFQLFRDGSSATGLIDEAGLTTDQVSVSDLPPGEYSWRVGSVQYLDGDVTTNWTKAEKIIIAAK